MSEHYPQRLLREPNGASSLRSDCADIEPGRRAMLAACGAFALSAALPGRARAEATHRFRHGAFDVTVLSDGFLTFPSSFVAEDVSPAVLRETLAGADPLPADVILKTNIPLVRLGDDLILVDIGAGSNYQSSEGLLAGALLANGIDTSAITKVVLTHAHPDHIWGMLDAHQRLRYPNAAYYVGAGEWRFWTAPDVAIRLPESFRSGVPETQRALAAVRDRLTLVKPGDEIVPGMRVLDTPGHTPGHISLELAGGGAGLIITADAVTHEIISFEHPTWRNAFDFDSDLAARTRSKLLDRLAYDKTRILSYHLPYPGLGYTDASKQSFVFVASAEH